MRDPVRAARQAANVLGPAMDGVGGPLGLVGRAVGLGGDELDAGVPKWAWFGVGIVAGGIAMYFLRDRIAAFAAD